MRTRFLQYPELNKIQLLSFQNVISVEYMYLDICADSANLVTIFVGLNVMTKVTKLASVKNNVPAMKRSPTTLDNLLLKLL